MHTKAIYYTLESLGRFLKNKLLSLKLGAKMIIPFLKKYLFGILRDIIFKYEKKTNVKYILNVFSYN